MRNALYSGFVIHNRSTPTKHRFSYNIRMFFLDIDSIDSAFTGIPFVSVNRFNLLSFHNKNYMPTTKNNIRGAVEQHLKAHGYDFKPNKIFILTQLAYFGYCYNPVSFYYCYDENMQLTHLLAEVNNTPWNERHVYVAKVSDRHRVHMHKEFHVSPFLPMDLEYTWAINTPGEDVKISMACSKQTQVFHAAMKLQRSECNFKNCLKSLIVQPFATQLVIFRIYWQALILFLKKTPFYAHPNRSSHA